MQNISDELAVRLNADGVKKNYSAGQILFSEGDKADYLPIILKGSVRMMRFLEPGKEVTIGIFRSGEMFAIPPVFDGKNYPSTAESMESSEILLISRTKFLLLLRESSEFSFAVLGWMCDMLRDKTAAIQTLATSSPEHRIAGILLRLIDQEIKSGPVKIKLRREDIAKMAGLTTETTIRTVKKLAARNLFDLHHGKIIINSDSALRDFLE